MARTDRLPVVRVEGARAPGPFLFVCEHASAAIPAEYGDLGLTAAQRASHIAWDPGALGLARALARRLDAPLVHAGVSRLVYDLNRPPHAPGAIALRSEIHDIPGNRDLPDGERLRRTRALYLPFHDRLRAEIALRLAAGHAFALVTVHSFTPVWFGTPRAVELGLIHDADNRMATAMLRHAQVLTGLVARLNDPYSAADGVAHTLALHATPMGLPHVMIEVRNDLIATPAAQAKMAAQLSPCLAAAWADVADPKEVSCRAG